MKTQTDASTPKRSVKSLKNQARHKTFDISPAVLASIQTPPVSARNWLGLMAAAQHTTAGQPHSEDASYTAFNGTYVRQFFGSSKDGGLTAMSEDFNDMFELFDASKSGGWCLGIRLKDDNAQRLREAMADYDIDGQSKVDRLRLSAEQPYLVQLNDLRPIALLSLKEVADYLSTRMDKAPTLAALKKWERQTPKVSFGTSTQCYSSSANPPRVLEGGASEPFGTSIQCQTPKVSFGTSTQCYSSSVNPSYLPPSGLELLPERTRNGHRKRGNDLSIMRLHPFITIGNESVFQSPHLRPYRSMKMPDTKVMYSDEAVTIDTKFDVQYLQQNRHIAVKRITDALPEDSDKALRYIECYDYHVRLLAETDGHYSWTYWRRLTVTIHGRIGDTYTDD
ncbi:hypothetical protein JCM19233_3554 [Vibrio astriarenae]|nr:hypothetical protein JCM19233_3554 [Vibrio sp. C7]